jgi:cell division protein ZapA
MPEKPNQVQVEIFGQSYSVRAGADPDYVRRLAAHVDAAMQDVSRQPGTVDSLRIAVLAALNIADECFQLRARGDTGEKSLEARARRLAEDLAAALEE